jgi:phage host-nuclease inhibitor protein Gam
MNEPIIHTLNRAVDTIAAQAQPPREIVQSFDDFDLRIDYETPPETQIDTRLAEFHLQKVLNARDRLAEIENHKAQMIEKATSWAAIEEEKTLKQIKWHETSVFAFAKRMLGEGKEATVNLVNGQIKRKRGRVSSTVTDRERVPAEFRRIVPEKFTPETWEPDLTKINNNFKKTGEIIEGVETEKKEDWFEVT